MKLEKRSFKLQLVSVAQNAVSKHGPFSRRVHAAKIAEDALTTNAASTRRLNMVAKDHIAQQKLTTGLLTPDECSARLALSPAVYTR